MRHIVYIAPFPAEITLRFLRALGSLSDIRISGVGHTPPPQPDLGIFHDLARVERPLDTGDLHGAVARLTERHGRPYRILGLLEPLQGAIAQLREVFGVEGTNVATAELFRDKAQMKDALRAAGLPCARHRLLRCWRDAADFIDEVGFPVVLKPLAGMGCKATWRITGVEPLRAALGALGVADRNPALAEEMIRGSEHSLETITAGGQVRFSSITNYHPTPLEVVESPWIQWVVVAPRDIDGPELQDVHAMGRRAVTALGLEQGMTHMEWFRRQDGSVAIGEIAARPPGAQITRLTGLAHDTSMYRAWARAVVDDAFDGPWPRQYASGAAFLRGMGHGRVLAVDGVARAQQAIGELVVEAKLPTVGAPRSDSYEGDGYVLVRHPETAVVERALSTIVGTVRTYYG